MVVAIVSLAIVARVTVLKLGLGHGKSWIAKLTMEIECYIV